MDVLQKPGPSVMELNTHLAQESEKQRRLQGKVEQWHTQLKPHVHKVSHLIRNNVCELLDGCCFLSAPKYFGIFQWPTLTENTDAREFGEVSFSLPTLTPSYKVTTPRNVDVGVKEEDLGNSEV